MFIGASSGSPGGGIKLARVILSVKSFKTMMIRMYHPKAILTLGINGKRMDTSAVLPIVSFVLLFFATAMLFGCILIFLGLDLASAISTSLSFLGGYGPGFGDVGVNGNYSTLNNSVKIILSVCMMVGRIELIPVYLLLSIRFWKK
jgi:trk system potassium uptake protein TrkH